MHLLDREAELQRVAILLGEVHAGSGRSVVIQGPAGIGKSALLDEVCAMTRQAGFAVLRAGCADFEQEIAFGVVRQLMEPVIRGAASGERERLLAGPAGLAARALVDPIAGPPVDDFQLFHSLYWMCAGLAGDNPVVLAVDDAHWADTPSLRWLRYLARRSEDVPVLIVLVTRPDDADVTDAALGDIVRSPTGAELVLAPLSPESTARVLEGSLGRLPDPDVLTASFQATGGNPFLVTEVARAMRRSAARLGPEFRIEGLQLHSIARSVDTRLRRLPVTAQALARAATTFGREVEFRHAAALAGLPTAEAARAADALHRAGIVDCVDPLRFEHSLIREAILSERPPAGLARDHKRAAEILAAEGTAADRVAGHLLLTTPMGYPWVTDRLREAAQVALHLGAPASAITFLRRALAEPPAPADRWSVLWMLGRSELLTADPAAAEHLQEAFETCGEPDDRPSLAGELADALARIGRVGDAYRILDDTIAALPPDSSELGLRLEARLLGVSQLDHAVAARAHGRLDSLAHLQGETTGQRMVLAIVAYIRALDGTPVEEVLRLGRLALADGRGLTDIASDDLPPGSTHLTGNVFGLLSRALATLGEIEVATEILRLLDADARARGSIFLHLFARLAQGALSYTIGDVSVAAEEAAAAIGLAKESGMRAAVPVAAALAVAAALERGEHDAALQLLDGLGLSGPLPPMGVLDQLLFFRGVLRGETGHVDDALEDLFESGRRASAAGYHPILNQWRVAVSPLLSAAGRADEARVLLAEELDVCRHRGAARPLALALRASGLVEGGAQGLELLAEAADLLRDSEFRLESARTEIVLGAALRRANRRTQAREHLGRGLELAVRCGAAPLAARARAELSAAGARPRRLFVTGPESLTASERRVAEMAAAGRSNPEIAQALFVTRKTVETHLGRVYQKLAIGHRGELHDALSGRATSTDRGAGSPA